MLDLKWTHRDSIDLIVEFSIKKEDAFVARDKSS